VRRIDEGAVTDPREQVGWLAKIGDASRFHGLHADLVPESTWREIPQVAAMLRGITEPPVLSNKESDRISKEVRICLRDGYGSNGLPIRKGGVWARESDCTNCREASVASTAYSPARRPS